MSYAKSKNEYVKKIFSYVLHIVSALFIGVICTYRIGEHQYPAVYGDEFGYWAVGSFFAGLHWEEITTINPYYGYGYGFFLSIILRLVDNPITGYKIALYCNVGAMIIVYILVLKVETILLKFTKCELCEWLKIGIAFLVSCFPSYVQYINYTWAEIPTLLFTWCGILAALKCIEKNIIKNQLILILISFILITIHMRNFGFFIIALLFLIYLNICSKQRKDIFYIILFSFVMIAIFGGIKEIYTGKYYVEMTGNYHNSNNEFRGIFEKITSLFSATNIKRFFIALMGKLYYLLVSSFGLAAFPFFVSAKFLFKMIKLKKLSLFENAILFGICVTIIMIMISNIYMVDYSTRFDLLLYGRYFENSIPYIMLISIILIISEWQQVSNKEFIYTIILTLITSIVVEISQNYKLPKGNIFINITPVASWLIENDYAIGSYISLGMIIVFILTILLIINQLNKFTLKRFGIMFFTILLIYQEIHVARYVLDNGFFSWSVRENTSDLKLVEQIYELEIQDNLFYFPDGYILDADGLQYLLKDNTIHVIGEIKGDEEYILTSYKNVNLQEIEGYNKIGESNRLILWKKQIQ